MTKVRENYEQRKTDKLQQERYELEKAQDDLNLEKKMVKIQAAEAKVKQLKSDRPSKAR